MKILKLMIVLISVLCISCNCTLSEFPTEELTSDQVNEVYQIALTELSDKDVLLNPYLFAFYNGQRNEYIKTDKQYIHIENSNYERLYFDDMHYYINKETKIINFEQIDTSITFNNLFDELDKAISWFNDSKSSISQISGTTVGPNCFAPNPAFEPTLYINYDLNKLSNELNLENELSFFTTTIMFTPDIKIYRIDIDYQYVNLNEKYDYCFILIDDEFFDDLINVLKTEYFHIE